MSSEDVNPEKLWKLQLLGCLRAVRGELSLTRFRTRKTAELLAYLAYFQHRSHPRELLIELLWPECDLDAGRHSLSVALSSLRQQLEPPGVSHGSVLQTDRFSVRLNPATVETDVARFDAEWKAATTAPDDARRVQHLVQAVEAYTGDLLPGYYEDWVLPEQQRLDEQFFQALRHLIARSERAGDFDSALQQARRAVAANRLREEAHREVIRVYAAAGEPGAAIRQYRELERILREDLDTEPSAATRLLLRRITERDPESGGVFDAPAAALLPAAAPDLEPVGGAVPPGSRFYVLRGADEDFELAAARRDSIILIKGPRQVGKSSLLARGLQRAREAGSRVVLTHFQLFNAAHLETADTLLLAMAQNIAEQLDLNDLPEEQWDPRRGPNPNFRRFLRRQVLSNLGAPLVWALDEVDRIFACPFGSEIFGLFRSWHDERALEPGGPWSGLSIVISYSTEAHLFITDLNQSPFNVGTRLILEDFTAAQVADLNVRHGSPLRSEQDLAHFISLVGGHPYLIRQGLYEMATRGTELPAIEAAAQDDQGLYGPHLRRVFHLVAREPALTAAVRAVIHGTPCPSPDSFYRLCSAGILSGDSWCEPRFRCRLYHLDLQRRLE